MTTVGELLGRTDFDDGPLLEQLQGRCDAFVTVDRSIPFQQALTAMPFGVLVLRARSNRLEHMVPLAHGLLSALGELRPGQVLHVGA